MTCTESPIDLTTESGERLLTNCQLALDTVYFAKIKIEKKFRRLQYKRQTVKLNFFPQWKAIVLLIRRRKEEL